MSVDRRKMCAIHQPNFFPWLGYFDKIARSDVFLLLDNVQFPKTAGTWINRVQLLSNNGPYWATAPIDRGFHGIRSIRESRFSPKETGWREKLRRSIAMQYSKASYFATVFPYVESLLLLETDNIADYNINAIRGLCSILGLDVGKLRRASTLEVNGHATTLLINMCRAAGADTYLCGGGSSGYQDDGAFKDAGIDLVYQNFKHPVYEQGKATSFHAGMSVIDALMHCGVTNVQTMLGVKHCR